MLLVSSVWKLRQFDSYSQFSCITATNSLSTVLVLAIIITVSLSALLARDKSSFILRFFET